MDVDIADPSSGESIINSGEAGEMVVRQPFPSMPCFFWGDHDGKKYRSSYFERFDNIDVWAQHDWLEKKPKTGGLVMHGRSDGVLSKLPQTATCSNTLLISGIDPSGIRFGSGEIYAIVEAARFNALISNSLCVGRRRPHDQDEDVFLFVVMSAGQKLTPELSDSLRQAIKTGLSSR